MEPPAVQSLRLNLLRLLLRPALHPHWHEDRDRRWHQHQKHHRVEECRPAQVLKEFFRRGVLYSAGREVHTPTTAAERIIAGHQSSHCDGRNDHAAVPPNEPKSESATCEQS